MRKYADIHCHMIPGVDDGSPDMDTTMKMLEKSYEEGARAIVFTSHYEGGNNLYQPEELDRLFGQVQQQASEKWQDLQLYLGNELLYEQGIVEQLKDGSVHTVNGTKFVLVEFGFSIRYQDLYHGIQEIQKSRFRPIIAHVERFHCLVKHPERISELREMGVYLQMNAGSMLGGMFNENAKWCRKLLKERCITFIGTDAHGITHRPPEMKETLKWMEKHLDADYIENITWNYPMKMLENKYPEI